MWDGRREHENNSGRADAGALCLRGSTGTIAQSRRPRARPSRRFAAGHASAWDNDSSPTYDYNNEYVRSEALAQPAYSYELAHHGPVLSLEPVFARTFGLDLDLDALLDHDRAKGRSISNVERAQAWLEPARWW